MHAGKPDLYAVDPFCQDTVPVVLSAAEDFPTTVRAAKVSKQICSPYITTLMVICLETSY